MLLISDGLANIFIEKTICPSRSIVFYPLNHLMKSLQTHFQKIFNYLLEMLSYPKEIMNNEYYPLIKVCLIFSWIERTILKQKEKAFRVI